MKKIALFLLVALFSVSFIACQQAESGSDADGTETTVTTPDANAKNLDPNANAAANTPPAKPDYQVKAEEMEKTTANFAEEEFDWGSVTAGDKVSHQFKFTNTGENELVLTRVKASCGCTTPSWSKDPIAPGAEGFIDVEFNSAGKKGMQRKTITVTGNFDGQINKILAIKGEVKEKEG